MPGSQCRHRMIQWIERQLRLGLPGYCAFCMGDTLPGQPWCAPCLAELPWNDTACRCCSEPLSVASSSLCRDCSAHPPAFTSAHVPFLYQGPIRRLIHDFKFQGSPRAGRLLVTLLSDTLSSDTLLKNDGHSEVLIPVPLHPRRARERGFNQAQWLAKKLQTTQQLPLIEAVRQRDTPSQRPLGRAARRHNLAAAFMFATTLPKRVALIDDVITTGATAHALALAARDAGAEEVVVYAVARTPRRPFEAQDVPMELID